MAENVPDRYHTYHEITHHTLAWQAALDEAAGQMEALNRLWHSGAYDEVIFAGCGSTFYLARTAAAIFRGKVGLPARALPSSDIVLFPESALGGRSRRLLVAISRSGTTTETLKAVEIFRARGDNDHVIAISCYEGSDLVKMATLALTAKEAHEQSIAQTRSFSSMLVAAHALCDILAGKGITPTLRQLPEFSGLLMTQHEALAKALGENSGIERFFFLGSGPFYGLACEAMLKMKEMTLSYSEAFHVLEFRHGPMSMVNERSLVTGLVSQNALSYEADVLAEMRRLGATVLALTPARLNQSQADYQVPLPEHLGDLERGPLYLPVLQLMAFYRALHNRLNPDTPTNLTAVVSLDLGAIGASVQT
jgi:glucosamine--fructose-6-phosphate aminotransferase (isomerizing)